MFDDIIGSVNITSRVTYSHNGGHCGWSWYESKQWNWREEEIFAERDRKLEAARERRRTARQIAGEKAVV